MTSQESIGEQILPEQFNMILLEFLVKNPRDFWNVNEISHEAGKPYKKGLNNTRVKKSVLYFTHKNFLSLFSDLPVDQQRKQKRESVKEITSDSYQITSRGLEIYEKITESCLDPVGQHLLDFKKIE